MIAAPFRLEQKLENVGSPLISSITVISDHVVHDLFLTNNSLCFFIFQSPSLACSFVSAFLFAFDSFLKTVSVASFAHFYSFLVLRRERQLNAQVIIPKHWFNIETKAPDKILIEEIIAVVFSCFPSQKSS